MNRDIKKLLSVSADDVVLVVGDRAHQVQIHTWQVLLGHNQIVAHKHIVDECAYNKANIENFVALFEMHRPQVILLVGAANDESKKQIALVLRAAGVIYRAPVRLAMSLEDVGSEAGLNGAADLTPLDIDNLDWRDQLENLRRQRGKDAPLVSVIVRSMDRPELIQALESIAQQTWGNLEVCVVCAVGEAHSNVPNSIAGVKIKRISDVHRLDRAQAANAGIRSASGEYMIFLDDDDLLYPTHIEKLCIALLDAKALGLTQQVAYTGVDFVDMKGKSIRVLNEVWDERRLRGANYIPIHAVLFAAALIKNNSFEFDQRLTCLEDWDFWLQLSTATPFLHVSGVSAQYRFGLGQSAISGTPDQKLYLDSRKIIFEKWKDRFSADEWVETFNWFDGAFNYYRDQTNRLEQSVADSDASLKSMSDRVKKLETNTATLKTLLQQAESQVSRLQSEVMIEHQRVEAIFATISWKITKPIRLVRRLLRGEFQAVAGQMMRGLLSVARSVYHRIPPPLAKPLKQVVFRLGGPIFNGVPGYEVWKRAETTRSDMQPGHSIGGQLILINDIAPIEGRLEGRIGIHLHLHYHDLATEFRAYFEAIPFPFDLYVSVSNEAGSEAAHIAFSGIQTLNSLTVEQFPNRGRDIGPMIAGFGGRLMAYDYVAHVHSKKSLYNNGATDGWRNYLCEALFGHPDNLRRIFQLLQKHGLVYPQMFWRLPYAACTWLANAEVGRQLLDRLALAGPGTTYFDFPAGSMFWARGDTLRPLLGAGITFEDFPEEAGQKDGTLAHAVERVLGCLHEASGRSGPAVIADLANPSWSAWRLDQYLGRTKSHALHHMDDRDVRVVVFNIFGAILHAPFSAPEQARLVVAQKIGADAGDYLRLRAEAERVVRMRTRSDPRLQETYAELQHLSGWSSDRIQQILSFERAALRSAFTPREDGIYFLNQALIRRLRIVFVSDTGLELDDVEATLQELGVIGWHSIYLSSREGVRKDSGALFEKILVNEGVASRNILVFGDNERSDLQVPGDQGARVFHLMRHHNLAHGLPRLHEITSRPELREKFDWSMTLGLITRKFYAPATFESFEPSSMYGRSDPFSIGYGVLGPLVFSFVQWLIKEAERAGQNRLWFLAREGQLIQEVYSLYSSSLQKAPEAIYLRLSRRAVSVPSVGDFLDITKIASENFGPAPLSMFMEERFGLLTDCSPGAKAWETTIVTIKNGDLSPILSVLQEYEPYIRMKAEEERLPLLQYLSELGWDLSEPQAVVDVGYAGSIQHYLNRLLEQPVHGYYMLTNNRVKGLQERFGVECVGCFHENVDLTAELPQMYSHSFVLEKLMSADDPQVVCYKTASGGSVEPVFKLLSEEELAAQPVRAQVRAGVMAFVSDFVMESQRFGLTLECPVELARMLYNQFAVAANSMERATLSRLSLDDHYCGRGVVS